MNKPIASAFIDRFPRWWICCALLALSLPAIELEAAAMSYIGPPLLDQAVAKSELPAVRERLPQNPRVVPLDGPELSVGRHGGGIRLLMARSKDVRQMVVYGYARLVCYNRRYQFEPDILERIDIEGDRVFTLRLRKGHKWSDGHPLTSEDFRYYWEDVANNNGLSPTGPEHMLMVDGDLPRFEVIDETTVRYSWSKPNPFFVPAMAAARPLFIYRPAHYLKQFHQRYAQPDELQARIEQQSQRNWVALHIRMDSPYKNRNPRRPTLQPWVNTTPWPSTRFVFERNPYFHRVDPEGRQLPYLDRVVMNIADAKIIPAKTGSGESDLQARNLSFSDYTFLKESEARTNSRVLLWRTTRGAHMALYPNLNVTDPVWRKLVREVRLRRALSLAINRREINQVLYYGLAVEGNNSVHPSCVLYRPQYRESWAQFDLDTANALLDELGLTERDERGIRLLPDGRPMVVIVETAGEDTDQTDVLELIHDSWLDAGVKLFTKPSQREVFRNRIFSGETLMAVWSGLENGMPTASVSPESLAPTSQQQLQWPKWGQYYDTKGASGEPPDMPPAQELMRLNEQWRRSSGDAEREAIWHKMLQLHADQVYTIGLVADVPRPVVVTKHLRNVPKQGIYNWDPGAHFGIYNPAAFWLDRSAS